MSLLFWAMLLLLLGIVLTAADVLLGLRQLSRLHDVPPRSGPGPLVSLVIAARDEAGGIEAAARSLLAQEYPALEFIMVNDRSSDATGAILDRLAGSDARVRVVHLRDVPAGWLGKNHALARGTDTASGEWILFTDADIVMHPTTVARAMAYVERRGVDHLTLLPDLVMPSLILKAFVSAFILWFSGYIRPWKARDPGSRFAAGVGAFNLVRASAYRHAGGHAPIRMRPDDDIKLGVILKRSGARQDVVLGKGLVSVEWYASLREAVQGLMKNSFAVVNYNPVLMLLAGLFYLVVGLAPPIALLFGAPAVQVLGGIAVAVQLAAHWQATREAGVPAVAALLYPVVAAIFAWIILRALILNLWQGGIVWRGTFYALAELRRNRV